MKTNWRGLIADDEPVLRRHLSTLLADLWPELEIVAMAADGDDAWQHILDTAPDVAFLDIRMPGQGGLDLARRFEELERPPLVVFVTAFDQHAVAAFESEAVDYLLKPVEEERLTKAVERLRDRLAARNAGEDVGDMQRLRRLLSELLPQAGKGGDERLQWIKAGQGDHVHMLSVDDVDYFLAESKYTTIHSQGRDYLIRTSIAQLERQLDPNAFWRIHRACIVRVGRVARVERDFGRLFVVLQDDKRRLPVSRSRQNLFLQM